MVLVRLKTADCKGNSLCSRMVEVMTEMATASGPVIEEDFKPQRVKIKRGSTNGQTWEVDVGKKWVSSQHQSVGQQITNNLLEKGPTRNTARSWWIALKTMKEMEDCLKKLDRGVSRRWCPEEIKLEVRSQLRRTM